MIPEECKRLAEVDFALSAVNDACMRENNRKTRVDSGHLSLLHSWWARRPLASSRAVLLTLLLPDPTDPLCPKSFKEAARKELRQVGGIGVTDTDLQKALLAFVSHLADWDLVGKDAYLSTARKLVQVAQGSSPNVFDPFAGGGSIPLEGLRLGCEVTASDVNPVAWLLLKIALEWCGRKGPELAEVFETWSQWALKETESRLAAYYPADASMRKPLAYIWARTVRCEAPACGAVIPLMRSLWLSEAKGRNKAVRFSYPRGSDEPTIEIFTPSSKNEVGLGTVAGFKAACPNCHQTTPRERVQAQLRAQRGGAADAMLVAIVRQNAGSRGKDYYVHTPQDIVALKGAISKARHVKFEMASFPQNDTRAFPPGPYGINSWADALTPRQKLSRWIMHEVIEDALKEAEKQVKDKDLLNALAACLYAAYSDNAQYHTSLCVWLSEGVTSIFIQGSGVPMRADFVEGNPLSPNCDGLEYSVHSVRSAIGNLAAVRYQPSSPLLANALDEVLPEESVGIIFTDPPYANQIPYAHLSDFFYGWLRLGLRDRLPQAFRAPETEKARELTENRAVRDGGLHDRQWYESRMQEAFARMRGVIRGDGVGSVIFAHKDTDRWEALVSALVQAGWRTTGSWPIATERRQRMRGQGYAALETSVHLVCRPRPEDAPVGDWGDALRELPRRVGDWMERLQSEGIRGADLVFACIGPALEIFSRYCKVETAEGREVGLPEFLEKVWEVVGRTALNQILASEQGKSEPACRDARGAGRNEKDKMNGAGQGLEQDARLTALFLWTLQTTNGEGKSEPACRDTRGAGRKEKGKREEEGEEEIDYEEEDEEEAPKKRRQGYSLIFDVVRRFAQPLGIHLPEWEGRIIETEKGVVRLLSVRERARQLFGEESAQAFAQQWEQAPAGPMQLRLALDDRAAAPEIKVRGRGRQKKAVSETSKGSAKAPREATTLDRVHAAMILQANGQSNALRVLLRGEQDRGPDFLRLANALSALYPKASEEKRLLDAMLLAMPR